MIVHDLKHPTDSLIDSLEMAQARLKKFENMFEKILEMLKGLLVGESDQNRRSLSDKVLEAQKYCK